MADVLFAHGLVAQAGFSSDFEIEGKHFLRVQMIPKSQFSASLSVRDTRFAINFSADADFAADVKGVLDGIGAAVVHYWKLEQASGTRFDEISSSTGPIDWTDVNTVGQAAGKVGNCADFTRANSEELTAGTGDLDFDGSADFSILMWAAVDDNASAGTNVQGPAFSKWTNSDRGWIFGYDEFSDSWQFVVSTNGSDAVAADGGTFISTAFAMVYADYDSGTGVTRCSTNDGTKGTASPGTTINQSAEPLRLGSTRFEGVLGLSDYFEGKIDEVIVFNRKLTDAEITAFYAGGGGRNLRDIIVKDFVF